MNLLLNIRVGWYLAVRQIRRSSKWSNGLIIFVMLLTFLNLVVVTGFLVGIVDGISNLFRAQETGDVVITAPKNKNYIEHSQQIISFLETLPQIEDMSSRYSAGAQLEADYKNRANANDKPNRTGTSIVGIDPEDEARFSDLPSFIGEGTYFLPNDYDAVLVGEQLIDRYAFGGDIPGLTPLKNVYPGTILRMSVNGIEREVVVRGIITTTANSPLATRVFMPETELRQLIGRDDYNVNQIALRLKSDVDAEQFRGLLIRSGIGETAVVQTFEQAIPSGVAEIRSTFEQMGNAISSVGLVVAAITIFIVIFINALTRRKYIGILKGIGISGSAIEIAYVFQSIFYAFIGSGIGLLILYGFLVPYVAEHPIVLPISNTIIVAPLPGTLVRVALLVIATVIAGYIPARMIVKKNTLDSILGRN